MNMTREIKQGMFFEFMLIMIDVTKGGLILDKYLTNMHAFSSKIH